jgi:HEAT repeat protein
MNQSPDTIKQKVLREMDAAIAEGNWQASCALLGLTRTIDDPETKADVLNSLLVMPGHKLHQEVAREIQELRSPSSVPYIRQVLSDGIHILEYTCSEPGVIAKWFSHALADINTPESIALIREFAGSSQSEVAEEMAYRLRRLNT